MKKMIKKVPWQDQLHFVTALDQQLLLHTINITAIDIKDEEDDQENGLSSLNKSLKKKKLSKSRGFFFNFNNKLGEFAEVKKVEKK